MNFPILSTKALAQTAIAQIENNSVNEREFNFNAISHGCDENINVNDLLNLLKSSSEKEMKQGISLFNLLFISLFGVGNYLDFLRVFDAQENALLAKDTLGDDATLLQNGYTTTEEMENGTLFVWCNEIMFIYNGDTYTITRYPHYTDFKFFEGEPAYVVGKVSQELIDKTIY